MILFACYRLEFECGYNSTRSLQPNAYVCPRCCKPTATHKDALQAEKHYFLELATASILDGQLMPHETCSQADLLSKLIDEIDWAVRDQWRIEYMAIVRDGIRVYSIAKRLFDDARFVVQQVGEASSKQRRCAAQRALRFVTLVKRSSWDTKGVDFDSITTVVVMAKLAAAFVDIACQSLGLDKKKDITFYDRVLTLLQSSGKAGVYSFPFDRLKKSRDTFTFDDKGLIVKLEEGKPLVLSQTNVKLHAAVSIGEECPVMASPLRGWSDELSTPLTEFEWKDPRECCLCHLCGDDDEDYAHKGDRIDIFLGRLLPMNDGLWVHASCALWSSEVWESNDDSLIHSVEKARVRGSHLKCFGCGYNGATVGCCKPNCAYNYHYPCAKAKKVFFTSEQQVFCPGHRSGDIGSPYVNDGAEYMKALMIAPEKRSEKDLSSEAEMTMCSRVGCLVVHAVGKVETEHDGFHSENYIYPLGYFATRIFWSTKEARRRTVYVLKIETTTDNTDSKKKKIFSITPGDDPDNPIAASSATKAYATLLERVRNVNAPLFSKGNVHSKLPTVRITTKKTFGLNGPQVCFAIDRNMNRTKLYP